MSVVCVITCVKQYFIFLEETWFLQNLDWITRYTRTRWTYHLVRPALHRVSWPLRNLPIYSYDAILNSFNLWSMGGSWIYGTDRGWNHSDRFSEFNNSRWNRRKLSLIMYKHEKILVNALKPPADGGITIIKNLLNLFNFCNM